MIFYPVVASKPISQEEKRASDLSLPMLREIPRLDRQLRNATKVSARRLSVCCKTFHLTDGVGGKVYPHSIEHPT